MASTSTKSATLDDARRGTGSPKMKARENAKDTLCRNVTIYGRCRYEDKGCAFNHDPHKINNAYQTDSNKKRLNVDSPSFTPSILSSNGSSPTTSSATMKKMATISPKAANAAPFQPRSISSRSNSSTPTTRPGTMTPDWSVAEVQEFVPQGFDTSHMASLQGNGSAGVPSTSAFDPFVTAPNPLSAASAVGPVQANPFSHDTAAALNGAFFANQSGFQQPVQYHMYAPIGPHSQNILAYQRNAHDFFLPNDCREDLQKKAAATLQTLPNTQLPAQVDYFHSLVPLDLNHQKNATIFGFPSWVYKAQSSKDGNFYALRRLEGFRLTNEKAIRSVQAWKRVYSGSVVTVHDAFTSRSFQDSSLIFVTDYHPLSKTLAEQHLGAGNRFQGRPNIAPIPEQVLWGYMTQIANGIKAIHSNGLAARIIDPSKILLTGRNRVRLNACAIMDVVQFDTQRSVAELQRQDLVNFGQLIVTLGANQPGVMHNPAKAMDHFTRAYTPQLKTSVFWLLNGLQKDERNIDMFITAISSQLMSTFDSALHMDDQLTSDLSRELENGRIVRLMTKLNLVNERPEYEHDRQWSENGERYFLKIFRDYVFHQVDAQGDPVVDLGHVLTCLNKLDAGSDEKVTLVSRDEQSCFVVSYKELKKALESSFQALLKPAGRRLH
ncbi:PAB-dependent poly(A)-specific ribonuclease subunit pan3 [Aspergillus heteromorphus CBS 117.55]|uniref:PAN2-PAN3 deadenylation complex subunit PAN3 n=1 Tax=Aspergillus heteromorphus CBS 117.55 TaxID=1448321 RepID=A0A317USE5_9EURO|nr:PAB-dependent poly(A)-specific ribonuclease subunit pan3 [Aspergillus heteromorphus CBS 117.55]PWY64038.1 PAB-dependent poly(A)-specific ribonuclease subunit pan3 [Aspergillus heteromorphus CBS 117.55]